MSVTHHRTETIDGHDLFFREAGDPSAPVVVLLHGFPSSSSMFRNLIPLLADRYRVIAPDYLGFGFSAAPSVADFDYTFDALADLTRKLLRRLDVEAYAMVVQDYGAPIGWRLALADPTSVRAIVSQNGNAYDEGFVPDFWEPIRADWAEPTEETEQGLRGALELEAIRWQYLNGVPEASVVDPDTWHHDYAQVQRPGNPEIQVALFRDYATNPPLYPRLHRYLRESRIPVLAVWGENDGIFGPAGATAFGKDAVDAEVHLLPGGHFLLESALDETAHLVRDFLSRRL